MPLWNADEYRRRLDAQDRELLAQAVAWLGDAAVGRAMVLFPDTTNGRLGASGAV
jgi:hypothetical protein